jgi:hypothetical protein
MMKDLEQQLILYFYQALDANEQEQLEQQLATDKTLAAAYQQLKAELALTADLCPAPDEQFESRVWQAVEPHIDSTEQLKATTSAISQEDKSKFSFGQIFIQKLNEYFIQPVMKPAMQPAFAMSLVLVLVAGSYLYGRYELTQDIDQNPEQFVASLSDQARHNILMQSVADHLERSSRLLTKVAVNSQEQSLIEEQQWAKKLLQSNRLFKSAAQSAEQWRIVAILEELEPVLIEMSTATENDLLSRDNIRSRIKQNSLVFKTRAFNPMMEKSI